MAAKKVKRPVDLAGIGDELDRVSLDRLDEKYPILASEIVDAIERGATPETVRRYVSRRKLPPEWVAWLESSARAVALD